MVLYCLCFTIAVVFLYPFYFADRQVVSYDVSESENLKENKASVALGRGLFEHPESDVNVKYKARATVNSPPIVR